MRDVFTTDVDRIVVDNEEVAKKIKEFIKIAMPRTKNKVELYDEPVPLFHKYGIEKEIELMYSRHVPLPSGGSLVIDSTEAIVAIDVNSGKFRDHSDAETTAFKTDMEAADEIPRQLRLRDLGGVIICDFIDLRYERHRRELEKRLHDNLKNDRAKTKVLRMSQFGIIEMTRQRMRPSLKRSIYFDCPHCKGAGPGQDAGEHEPGRHAPAGDRGQRSARGARRAVGLPGCRVLPAQQKARSWLRSSKRTPKKRILVRQDPRSVWTRRSSELFDLRDGLIYLDELGHAPQSNRTAIRGIARSNSTGVATIVAAPDATRRVDRINFPNRAAKKISTRSAWKCAVELKKPTKSHRENPAKIPTPNTAPSVKIATPRTKRGGPGERTAPSVKIARAA